jgi:geranylgeranyl reductase family protein
MDPKLDSDVIIAGAGPAGAAAAIYLAKAGLRVLLLDRQSFPRDKVCGDFVSVVALHELEALGITDRPEYKRSNVVRSAAVYLDGKHLLTAGVPAFRRFRAIGRVIPRKTLDESIVALARSSGANVQEGCYVSGYRSGRHSIEVSVQSGTRMRLLRAKVLIGADGSSSLVGRLVRGKRAVDNDRIIAVRGYFTGINGPADRADLYFASDSFPGYCWLFPAGRNVANVGVGMMQNTFPPASEHLRAMLLRLIAQDAVLKQRLAGAQINGNVVGWPLTTYNGRLPVVSERVLLVGDAAGLINPLNGEGIQYALLSARWAAQSIVDCANRGNFSPAALHGYAEKIDHELRYDLTLARSLIQLLCNRSLNPFWLEALQIIVSRAAIDPQYAQITGGILAGLFPVRTALGVPVVQKTLEQAVIKLGARALRGISSRPKNLTQLGVRTTQAAIDTLSAMLKYRHESERWVFNVMMSALDLARAARIEMVSQRHRKAQTSRIHERKR